MPNHHLILPMLTCTVICFLNTQQLVQVKSPRTTTENLTLRFPRIQRAMAVIWWFSSESMPSSSPLRLSTSSVLGRMRQEINSTSTSTLGAPRSALDGPQKPTTDAKMRETPSLEITPLAGHLRSGDDLLGLAGRALRANGMTNPYDQMARAAAYSVSSC
jgi:hypothetical protein